MNQMVNDSLSNRFSKAINFIHNVNFSVTYINILTENFQFFFINVVHQRRSEEIPEQRCFP